MAIKPGDEEQQLVNEVLKANKVPNIQNELNASKLTYTYAKQSRDVPDDSVAFSGPETICTDHMITVTWKKAIGWSIPDLKPYGPLSLMPTASCLHYATECFEGMKAYRGYDGRIRLFRPQRNAARFVLSANRIALPVFDPHEIEKLIHALVSTDAPKWLPKDQPGRFLYLRPTLIGTHAQLGVQAPNEAMLYIIMTMMPRLHASFVGGMKLLTSPEDMIRAWHGGFGFAKVGANYGPTLAASTAAKQQGFDQVLWLHGPHNHCTEAGGSNFFVVWKRKDGVKELVTAPLDDKLILDGVTRRSCLDFAQERLSSHLVATERTYTINEVIEASVEGRLLEAFSAGTAYFICGVQQIKHRDRIIDIPMGSKGEGGEITIAMRGWLEDITYGRVDHEWGVVVKESQ